VKIVVDMVSVDVPEEPGVRGRVVGLKDTERPVALGVTDELMVTVPVKPTLATVIVDVAEFPATKLPGLGVVEAIVRSGATVIVRIEVWVIEPKLAVTVTEYVADGVDAVVLITSVDVPEAPGFREIPVGVNEKVIPGSMGELVAFRLILPVSPRLLIVTVELADCPAMKLAGVADWAESVKSGFTVTSTETV
jgi:hypothetical protein